MPTKPPEAPALPGRFTPDQVAALQAPLDRAKVKQRSQSGRSLSYLEGWQVIAEANRIFGFDGWQRETITEKCVAEHQREVGRDKKPGWGVTYTCRVRITVGHAMGAVVIREGTGAGHGIDVDCGLAHESAIKEAETDAMKRALMTFGNPFGLALYDKEQREVKDVTELTIDELQVKAIQAAKRSGLTGLGVEALRRSLAKGTNGWANVPERLMYVLIEQGVKPENVEKFNAEGEALRDRANEETAPEEEPASHAVGLADRETIAALARQAA
jgi:DNA recombination protein Rad52